MARRIATLVDHQAVPDEGIIAPALGSILSEAAATLSAGSTRRPARPWRIGMANA